jgi:hypothetical protein
LFDYLLQTKGEIMDTWKLYVMGIVGAYVVLNDWVPVIWNKLFVKKTTTLTANDILAAYRILEPHLDTETAKAVRLQVAEGFFPTPIVVPEPIKAKDANETLNKLIDSLKKAIGEKT